ncbi:MAG: hypothetical protein A3F41_00020 [Coxiella sp. RIFCSPHIGHO2_12_FULL_44_14]|nr:MAG: hypothetical protein A3F41_00020 [Coxiella sp. RIFCSPHIGHO2_12_FULL_44_14]
MKKTHLLWSSLVSMFLTSAQADTLMTCPTVHQANQLFKQCIIGPKKTRCEAEFQDTDILLTSPTQSFTGGTHAFKYAFTRFKGVEILAHFFVCKYDLAPGAREVGWIIGSRHELSSTCRLNHAQLISNVPTCINPDPNYCKIVCD